MIESRWPMVSGTWTLGGAQHSTYCYEDEDEDEEWDDYDDVDMVMIVVMKSWISFKLPPTHFNHNTLHNSDFEDDKKYWFYS